MQTKIISGKILQIDVEDEMPLLLINAILFTTGKRYRSLPFNKHGVKFV